MHCLTENKIIVTDSITVFTLKIQILCYAIHIPFPVNFIIRRFYFAHDDIYRKLLDKNIPILCDSN